MAQPQLPENGVQDNRPTAYALTNATLYLDYQTSIKNATVLVQDGKILASGANVSVPQGFATINLNGKFVYPSFIEMYSDYGVSAPQAKNGERAQRRRQSPQFDTDKQGAYYWNQAVKPETNAAELFNPDSKAAEELRKIGFGAALVQHPDGIARGTSSLVTLADAPAHKTLLRPQAATQFSFSKGTSSQDYPSSLMGSIALLRQMFLDAQYQKQNPTAASNLSLDALNQYGNLPAIFDASDKQNILRADKIGDEFGVQFIIKGKGTEYQRISEIKNTNAPLIVPVTFPDAYDVQDPYNAEMVKLSEMQHWENAPKNLAVLARNKVPFAITAADLKDKKQFLSNVRKAVSSGLSETEALKALTHTPANLLKASDLGHLKKGAWANFLITSGNIFNEETTIYENAVQGNRHVLKDWNAPDMRGIYDFRIDGEQTSMKLEISGKEEKPSFKMFTSATDTSFVKAKAVTNKNNITLLFDLNPKDSIGEYSLTGWWNNKKLSGEGKNPQGQWLRWSATYREAPPEKKRKNMSADSASAKPDTIVNYFLPFAYAPAKPQTVLLTNATLWTNEAQGKIENTDILLENGKISKIGKGLFAPANALNINATGKHITSGIIDEHSHIAISGGVNEGTQSVTAEVRIGDVLDADDVDMYRQLAGGVVASQLLHGSANAVGGQAAQIKLRWGDAPDQLKIQGADGFIKFALGENVKQSNWGDFNTSRFPQTRMGVEQVYYDAFRRAKSYGALWDKYNVEKVKNKKAIAPHRDLELEALSEILNQKRFITCHSYVQSEINMLMHVADSMKFKVNTFTHILEGYKVADKMKKHNAGGSTFADWWAYKMEVKDAIPYNAAIMSKVGIVTAINSDDAEMARRLNHEAGKTIKYGGVSEEEALKMVTLNPAKLLHLDKRMGSLAEGKDADVVLWNANPLSVYAKPEKTFVDGRCFFDVEQDLVARQKVAQERQRLIQKMLKAKQNGEPTQQATPQEKHRWHCEDLSNYGAAEE
jgi:imidazolonepropionase-like amidohydrolase